MPYIKVGEENSAPIELYYEDHGTGKPVVLIHGWPLSGASWERQVPALVNAGHRVITYDRRGFGYSSKPLSGYDYDTMSMDLDKIITKLGLRDITLVGFSMGGGEVARYLGMHGSKRVSRAVFMGAIPPYLKKTADNPEGVDESAFKGIMAGLAHDRYAFLTAFFADFYNMDMLGGKLVSDEVARASWTVATMSSAKAMADCVPAWLTDFRKDISSITIPTLVLHGEADRIVPFPSSGKRIHEMISGSRLVSFKEGPHAINWTHAEQVNKELINFLGNGMMMETESTMSMEMPAAKV